MSAARGLTTRAAAAGVCCAVAALSYAGAVTPMALLAFVVPAVVLVVVVTALVARLSGRLGAVAGLGVALGVAEIVNLVSGSAHGPAARSTFAAAACTALAVTAVLSPAPALFAAAVIGVVVGALGLGAGAEVAPVAVATAVVTVMALGVIEASRRHWTQRRPHVLAIVAVGVLVGAAAATVALQVDRRLEGDPAVLAPGAVQPTIRPPELLGDPDPRPAPTSTPTSTPPSTTADAPPPDASDAPLRTIWLVVASVLVFLIVLAVLRAAWIAFSWRRLRRRLRRGAGPEQVAGAWVWSTRRLRAAGWPMPVWLSADVVAAGQTVPGLPRPVRGALREVAARTVTAVYAPPREDYRTDAAWSAADEVGRGAVTALSPSQRLGFALRSLSSVPSRPAAPASETPEESRS